MEEGGCALWYNEPQYITDIQEHLGVSIPVVKDSFLVPVSEYDGKVRFCTFKLFVTGSGKRAHDQFITK